LLAPNRRAVQVTTDLAGFWDRHYPSLRKSLMRRYSRHYWPEDPRTAEAPRAGLKRHVGKGDKGI
jgi:ATP-dependent helicase HrpB